MLGKVWGEISYPFPNFNGAAPFFSMVVMKMISYGVKGFVTDNKRLERSLDALYY